ncbi:HAMP domain-containing histidine kinase [Mobilitalea sibirica]|uniref:histidine kinase n=1 Tax=Mobilitalea sibirica TaxID=1462919 RepID=A0A8J7HE01_9FIRM|nr:HAMP domain-containing sensor histidine kinase [Mobilitalea sibirica]MBH1941434.1 HAMP domain-containing histidine kinase [Mobilitalea sibirica]
MKLWIRIFLSILLVSLTTLLVSSVIIINRNHLSNLKQEQDRSLNEFEFITSSIGNNMDFTASSIDTMVTLLNRYGNYYAQRGIHLMFYKDGQYLYNSFTEIEQDAYDKLLSVKENTKMLQVFEENGKHFIMVSGLPVDQKTVFLYAREINEIYTAREISIRLTVLLSFGLVILLGLLSYLYSKWITRPIHLLQKGAVSISQGDYSVRIPGTKDEFNDLAIAFNKMASAVENRTQELKDRAKELQIFIDDLSHEMNTPLTSIQGYAEFLQNANASEEQRIKAAGNIRTQARRMKDIYTKLMTLTLAREHKPDIAKVNVNNLLSDLQDTFDVMLKDHNIQWNTENHLTDLHIDRTLIHMLLSNLVKNSIQAMPEGGRIHIRAYKESSKPVIEVSDNGIGIPEDKIDQVIKPFFRVDKSRSRKTGGAGLGLSICKNIADIHNAQLSIHSREGKGTTIRIKFDYLS